MSKPFPIAVVTEAAVSGGPQFDDRLTVVACSLKGAPAAAIAVRFALPGDARLLKTTLSLCAECLTHVPAAVYEHTGSVRMAKLCATHGRQVAVLENDARYYQLSNKDLWGECYAPDRVFDIPAFTGGAACCGPGQSCGPSDGNAAQWQHDFADQRSNKTCTVLVEVTDACNLACRVCYADSKGDRILPLATFQQHLVALIKQKGGLDSVQITGGEASLHPQFWEMLAFVYAQAGVQKIYLPTNGIEFAKPGVAARLKPFVAKLLVLLQFDGAGFGAANKTLRRAQPHVLREKLIKQLAVHNIPMQLTMTLAHGVSEAEIAWVVAQGRKHRNVRLIAMQPATYSGRYQLPPEAETRLTLSDVAKGVAAGLRGKMVEDDFLPIPCSHPNCGWVTLFARRMGIFHNIARHVDLAAVMNRVAYKTVLSQDEMQQMIGSKAEPWHRRLLALAGRKFIRNQDVFGIAIKPFMDRHNYDQDRISNCCHHLLDPQGRLSSFCEYNARLRPHDSWAALPKLAGHVAPAVTG